MKVSVKDNCKLGQTPWSLPVTWLVGVGSHPNRNGHVYIHAYIYRDRHAFVSRYSPLGDLEGKPEHLPALASTSTSPFQSFRVQPSALMWSTLWAGTRSASPPTSPRPASHQEGCRSLVRTAGLGPGLPFSQMNPMPMVMEMRFSIQVMYLSGFLLAHIFSMSQDGVLFCGEFFFAFLC